jgi:tripartite-type tricarboxylate transporter receptor subunit TctC
MRTHLPHRVLAFAAALLAAGAASAQGYPNKPVRVIVPFTAGSAIDVNARVIGQKLADAWGQQVLTDNRPGANTIIGTEAAAKAPADGYTLVLANDAALAMNPALYPKLPYDPLKDFAPVTLIGSNSLLLVVPASSPVKSVPELLALARERKGELNYASGGNGSAQHIPMEMLMSMTGTRLTHVPYKGVGPALNDVIAGQVPVMFAGTPGALPHVKAGRLRALAIASPQRSAAAPDIPTVDESGVPGFGYAAWVGYLAPAATPRDVVAKLNTDIIRAINAPDVREKFVAVGFETQTSTPEEFAQLIQREMARMAKLVRDTGIKAEP